MREILFRGKTAVGGEWVQGFYSCTNECYMYVQGQLLGICNKRNPKNIHFITPFTNTDGIITPLNFISVIPETVGQYTNFDDKNNRKMFVDDIIKNIDTGEIGVVRWYPEHGAFVIRRISDNQIFWLYDNDFSKIEVIGNVYDNPELLTED